MDQIAKFVSTNGRWGAEVFAPDGAMEGQHCGYGDDTIRGTIEDKGTVGSFRSFVVHPDSTADTWISFAERETEVIAGATLVWGRGLQSGQYGAILLLGPVAVIKSYGYKGRSSWMTLYKNGVAQKLTAAHLVALGLVEPDKEPEPVAAPPEVDGAMAAALRRAGLA